MPAPQTGEERDEQARSERAPRSRSRVGESLDGKYSVVRFVGEGGMGAVYEARHVVIGRRFAIKFLHRDIATNETMVARFRREAEAAGRLESEHVVAIVDFGTADGSTPYLVMEYLPGENLASLLARLGPLPVERAVSIVLQLCRGLRVAHDHGIIHRDLKPENVFVVPRSDGEDLVKILDFGIAKLTADNPAPMTQSGMTMGTPHYMSPEQARGDSRIDERTDIYSVGVILYELLTGAKPHPGANVAAVLFHLLKQEPARVELLRPGIPADLARAVHCAFAFEADDRFRSVEELIAALRPLASARLARSTPPPPAPGEPDAALSATVPQAAQGTSISQRSFVDSGLSARPPGARTSMRRRLAQGGILAVIVAVAVAAFSTRWRDAPRPAGSNGASPLVGEVDALPPPRRAEAIVPAVAATTAPSPLESAVAAPPPSSRPAPRETRATPPRAVRPDAGPGPSKPHEDLYEP